MAISTYKVFLMKKADTGEQWSKLIDIKEFPDLGGEPEMLETIHNSPLSSPSMVCPSPLTTRWLISRPSRLWKARRSAMRSGLAALRAMALLLPMALTASSALTVSCPCIPWAAA